MKTETLFRAYIIARNDMDRARSRRQFAFGISKHQDQYAVEWQHHERHAQAFARAIYRRIAAIEADARLGRMVRRMNVGEFCRDLDDGQDTQWSARVYRGGEFSNWIYGSSPDAVLETVISWKMAP